MKGKKYYLIFLFVYICATGIWYVSGAEGSIDIDQISVQDSSSNTKIMLQSASSLSILDTYYKNQNPPSIVIDLDQIGNIPNPQVSTNRNSLVRDIRFEEGDDGILHLVLDVTEKVPYRIYTQDGTTIIELNGFLKPQSSYTLDPDIKAIVENADSSSLYLKDVFVSDLNDRIEVTADLTGTPVPQIFVLNNPLRLVIDLHNTLYSHRASNFPIHKNGIEKVRTAQFQVSDPYTITRMVFDLSEPKLYSIDTRDQKLTVSFLAESAADDIPSEPVVGPQAETVESVPAANPVREELPPPPPPEIETTADPITETDIVTVSPPDPMTVATTAPEPPVTQSPSQEAQFSPQTIRDTEELYSGEMVSMRFKGADLQSVIFYLAEFAGLNVVFDPGVTGTVSVDLRDVPWDQALDVILKQNRMGKSLEGNILRIAPIGVLTREQEEQQRLQESQELAGPVITRYYRLSYSKASDVMGLLRSRVSTRGEIIIDSRTNVLIVTDVEERMELIEKLIDVFDQATPQVSIEARIVEATSNFVRNLGIQWGWRGISDPFYGNQTSLKFPNKMISDGAMIPQGITTKGIGGPLGGYAVNLPAPAFNTAMGFSFANVLDTFRLDMAISALETTGTGRIISAPKVTTQNNKEANIIQGRQIPVQTVANFTVTTRYVNAALELRATPQITAEGTIIMNISIENNAADFANLVNGIPPLIRQSAETTVMIPDGGTTVIGGIYRTEDSITHERVPFLHKIPILGNLFRSFARTKQNRELLIFITPRIIK